MRCKLAVFILNQKSWTRNQKWWSQLQLVDWMNSIRSLVSSFRFKWANVDRNDLESLELLLHFYRIIWIKMDFNSFQIVAFMLTINSTLASPTDYLTSRERIVVQIQSISKNALVGEECSFPFRGPGNFPNDSRILVWNYLPKNCYQKWTISMISSIQTVGKVPI